MPPPAGRTRPRRAALAAASVVIALLIGLAIGTRGRGSRRPALPPPVETRSAAAGAGGDFAGQAACAGCHSAEHAAWTASTHGRAGGSPGPRTVIAPFAGRPLRFRDAIVLPERSPSGDYVFRVRQRGRVERIISVAGVVGGGHLAGGGTQGFLARHDDGTLRFLPFDYSRDGRTWFCNTGTRLNQGWVPISERLALADCGDWPPARVMGDVERFGNCQGCHGSRVRAAFDTTTGAYDTRYATLAVDCESCHGPAARHVELMREGPARTADIGLAALAALDKDRSLDVCFQCHAVKDRLAAGFEPGRRLGEFYSVKFPLLGDRPLFPDGRVRTFAYQENQTYSDCYLSGPMRCTDCHDPHSQRYRDVSGLPLAGRFADGQCTSCHPSKSAGVERHTGHRPESTGSRCVACHMPYLQHPEVGARVRYARSDHTIPIPRPAADSALGVISACAACHADRPASVLDAQMRRWSGAVKPRRAVIDSQLGPAAASRVLAPDAGHAFARFAGLARVFESELRPDMTPLDEPLASRLRELAADSDLDVRALALAGLHLARGEDRAVRRLLARALDDAAPRDRALRARWALALGFAGDAALADGRADDALAAYRKALEVTPDDPRMLFQLAGAERSARDLDSAIRHYRESLALDPAQPLALVNLALARSARGDTLGAIAELERAIRLAPHEPLAHYNLGNLRLLGGDPAAAARAYARVVELDASIAPAHFNLARAHLLLGDRPRALAAARAGLEFQPGDVMATRLVAELERLESGGR